MNLQFGEMYQYIKFFASRKYNMETLKAVMVNV